MNKIVLIISCFVLSSSFLFSQTIKTKEVPKSVISQFKVKSPSAKSAVWEKDNDTYMVSFTEDKAPVKGYYQESGEWIKTMFFVEKEDLPTNIINYVKKNYASFSELNEIYFVKQQGVKDYYLVDVWVPSEKIISTMKFTATGRYISEEKREMPLTAVGDKDTEKDPKEKKNKKRKSKKTKSQDPDLVSQDKLPEAVLKTFKKRFMNATDAKWYKKSEDTIYRVTCVFKNENAEGYITDKGVWINTIMELNTARLPSAVNKSIAQFYTDYSIVKAWNEIRADKKNQIIVDVIEGKNEKRNLITKMYFDKNGRIIKIEDAPVPDEPEAEMTEKEKKEQARMEKEFKKHQKMKYDPSNINESELPSGIGLWIAREYPEYLVRKAEYNEFDEFPDHGRIYKVLIERPGVNQPYATGYFTHSGKLIEVIDDFKKEEDKKEEKRKVSKEIVTAFKEQYPKIDKVEWVEGENGTWIAVYVDKDMESKAAFSANATWLQTATLIEMENKIPSSIRNYVAKQLPDKVIETCYLMSKPGIKPYYNVTLYERKSKTTSELDFTTSGKIIE
ncbi:MAG: PepSY-like domain-containing protein [Bacteroidales bacterium]|nr:PepSY-like domain-containing protein [Bacteroidales bacterium]